MPGNIASKRVIEKIGMKYKYIVASPQEHELYSITKNEYYKIYNC
jgi:RimJ/RimL family protein N-acetyltransferase